VNNPTGLLSSGRGATTLTYERGQAAPLLVLDYGINTGGIPQFDVKEQGGSPTLRAAYSEDPALISPQGDGNVISVALFQSGDPQRYDTYPVNGPGIISNPTIQGGERYQLLTLDSPGTVTLSSVQINTTFFRGTAKALRGHFVSSSKLLNKVWYQSEYTLNLNQVPPGVTAGYPAQTNGKHLILDGGKRDRAVWSGDQGIAGLANLYSGDPAYARDSLELLNSEPASSAGSLIPSAGAMAAPGPMSGVCAPAQPGLCLTWSSSYSLVLIPALWQYYLHTGDIGFLRQQWSAVVRNLAFAAQLVQPDGLISVGTGPVDDSTNWNVEKIHGELTYVNAVYYQALTQAAQMQQALGTTAPVNAGCPTTSAAVACAGDYAAQAARIRQAVNTHLWNPKTRVYDSSTTQRGDYVQDANVLAVLSGIAGPGRSRHLMKVLDTKLASPYGNYNVASPVPAGYDQVTSPFMSGYNVLADLEAGRTRAALSLMRREWGYMLTHGPQSTAWERIEKSGKLSIAGEGGSFSTSAAHAWSSGPVPALSGYVLGVQPIAPGFTTFAVTPHTGGLRWAQGRVPTPSGPITVKWGLSGLKRSPTSFTVQLKAPRSTTANLSLPMFGHRHAITCNGTVVWNGHHALHGAHATQQGDTVIVTGLTGSRTCSWRT